MKRYTVDIEALKYLSKSTSDAQTELGSTKKITDETLTFRKLPYMSVVLEDEEVKMIKARGLHIEEELIIPNCTLAAPIGYEKVRSYWYKSQKRGLTGRGCKVAVLDTGCNTVVVPCEFQVNYVDMSPIANDVFGHGTQVSAIIKHPEIAIAPDCEFTIMKGLTDTGSINLTATLACLDYVIDNNLDIVNLSWRADSTTLRDAIASVVANGTVVCAAAGNDSVETTTLVPACLPGVVAVNSIAANVDTIPGNRNILVRGDIPGAHGITIACNGVGCQTYTKDGVYIAQWGTSVASPFFAGVFAIYKEQLGIEDNYKVLDYILKRARKTQLSNYYGVGTPMF